MSGLAYYIKKVSFRQIDKSGAKELERADWLFYAWTLYYMQSLRKVVIMRRDQHAGIRGTVALLFLAGLTVPCLTASPEAQERQGPAKIELGFWGGIVQAKTLGSTAYQDSWTTFLGTAVSEKTAIGLRTKDAAAFLTSLTYFFHSHAGVQILAGSTGPRTNAPPAMSFSWTLPDGSTLGRTASPAAPPGRMTTVPVCFNFVERLTLGRWRLEISAGPATYFHVLNQDSAFGYSVVEVDVPRGRPDLPPSESYDAVSVPLRIPRTSWNAWGGDLGAGIRFQAAPWLALAAEARYFYCPDKALSWAPQTGTYAGMFSSDFPSVPFGSEDLQYFSEIGQTFELKVKPSFWQVSLGLLIALGR